MLRQSVGAVASGRKCARCAAEVPGGARFCGACGLDLGAEAPCAKCGTRLPAHAQFCLACGERVGGEVRP
jgi:hypothetical protein